MRIPQCRIAQLRFRKFLSQKDVAEMLGVSQQYYGRLEKNPDKIDIGMARKLKRILELKFIDELIEDAV